MMSHFAKYAVIDYTLLRSESTVPVLTVRNLSEETHRALRHRAAEHGRSTEAEVRAILEETVRPVQRMKIGSELFRIAQEIGGMDDLEISRDRGEAKGASFE
jgi:antitoxin FitA